MDLRRWKGGWILTDLWNSTVFLVDFVGLPATLTLLATRKLHGPRESLAYLLSGWLWKMSPFGPLNVGHLDSWLPLVLTKFQMVQGSPGLLPDKNSVQQVMVNHEQWTAYRGP